MTTIKVRHREDGNHPVLTDIITLIAFAFVTRECTGAEHYQFLPIPKNAPTLTPAHPTHLVTPQDVVPTSYRN